jgi:propionyl-CoA synthetase
VAAFRDVTIVDRLPKTRSGKILRKTMRQIVDGEPYTVPATIEDPSVIDTLVAALSTTVSAPATQAVTLPR